MWAIILGLLLAVGVGGGAALSGGGGGGGSSPAASAASPAITPLGDNAKVQGEQGTSLSDPSFTSGGLLLSAAVPTVTQDENGNTVAGTDIKQVNITDGAADTSSAYGSFYEQPLGQFSQQDANGNLQQVNKKVGVMVGGKSAGLELGEFGYQKLVTSSQQAADEVEYAGFYAYDKNAAQGDPALTGAIHTRDLRSNAGPLVYEGAVLGYATPQGQTGEALEGASWFEVNLGSLDLTGKIVTFLQDNPWYAFGVTGKVDANALQANLAVADATPFAAANGAYRYQAATVQSSGTAVLLENGNSSEIVGNLSLDDVNQTSTHLHTYLSFGGKVPQEPAASPRPAGLDRLSAADGIVFLMQPAHSQAGTSSWSNNQMLLSGQHFTQVDRGNYFELDKNNLQNYSAVLTVEDYRPFEGDSQYLAQYMDGFSKLAWSGEGLSDGKYVRVKQFEKLGLGGRVLGLTKADYGYQLTRTEISGDPDLQAEQLFQNFYVYDLVSLLNPAFVKDTVSYQGNVLGYATQVKDGSTVSRSLTGTNDFTLNFNSGLLTGTLNTRLDNKPYHIYHVNGRADTAAFTLDNVTVDASQVQDSIKDEWGFVATSVAAGKGQLLAGNNGYELVGELTAGGKNASQNQLANYLVYGAKETSRTAYVAPQGQPDIISPVATGASTVQDLNGPYAMTVRTEQPGQLSVRTSRPKADENGYLADEEEYWNEEEYTVTFTADNYQKTDTVANYFAVDSSRISGKVPWAPYWETVSMRDELALGGAKLGLTAGDFGYHKEIYHLESENDTSYDVDTFTLIDTTRVLQNQTQWDGVLSFAGTVLGSLYYDTDDDYSDKYLDEALAGTSQLSFNLANSSLTGTLDTQVLGKQYHTFNVSGTVYNGRMSGGQLAVDTSKQVDSSLAPYAFTNFAYNAQRSNGANAAVLNGTDGNLEIIGSGYVNYWDETGGDSLSAYLAFGAKEQEPSAPVFDNTYISTLTNRALHPHVVVWSDRQGVESAQPTESSQIKDGAQPPHYRRIFVPEVEGKLAVDTGIVTDPTGNQEKKQTLYFSQADYANQSNESNAYARYRKTLTRNGVYHVNELFLGGATTGLTAADFGMWSEAKRWPNGAEDQNVSSFYLYDADRWVPIQSNDSVHFDGKVFVHAEDSRGNVRIGTSVLDLDLLNSSLSGSFLFPQYAQYNVDFTGSVDANKNAITVDGDSTSGVLGGWGKILSSATGLETVGTVYRVLDAATDTQANYAFGAKETSRIPYEEPEPAVEMPFAYVSVLATPDKYTLAAVGESTNSDVQLQMQPDSVRYDFRHPNVQNGVVLREWVQDGDGSWKYKYKDEIPYTVNFDASKYRSSDQYAGFDLFKNNNSYLIKGIEDFDGDGQGTYMEYAVDEVLLLGGRQLGLSNVEFGTIYRVGKIYQPTMWEDVVDVDPFYFYNSEQSVTAAQVAAYTAPVHFDGQLIGKARAYNGAQEFSDHEKVLLTGTTSFDVDLVSKQISGEVNTLMNGLVYNKLNVNGTVNVFNFTDGSVKSEISFSPVQVDESVMDPTIPATFKYASFSDEYGMYGGHGNLVTGDDGLLEMGGFLHIKGQNVYGNELKTKLVFGAKERPAYMSPLMNRDNFPGVKLESVANSHYDISDPAIYGFALSLSDERDDTILVDHAILERTHGDSAVSFKEGGAVFAFNGNDFQLENDYYKKYHQTINAQLSYNGGATWEDVTVEHDLYFAGEKAGLTAADFGMSNSYRPVYTRGFANYQDFILYDPARFYNGGRNDQALSMSGNVLMSRNQHHDDSVELPLKVFTGNVSMELNLLNANLRGHITMDESRYDIPSFTGRIEDMNKIVFESNVADSFEGYGKLFNGDDGLESVGVMSIEDIGTYTYGAKESDVPYVAPQEPTAQMPFDYVSALTAPMRYQSVSSMYDSDNHNAGVVVAQNNAVLINGEKNRVENGVWVRTPRTDKPKYESVTDPYEIVFNPSSYKKSDTYADYFEKKNTWSAQGWYPENPQNASEGVYLATTVDDLLALGGRLVGLTNADFGYHQILHHITSPEVADDSNYYAFYMADLAQTMTYEQKAARNDTVHFDGQVLGGLEREFATDNWIDEEATAVTGTSSFDINFNTYDITGVIHTFIDGMAYNKFTLQGSVARDHTEEHNNMIIDTILMDSSSADQRLSKWQYTQTGPYCASTNSALCHRAWLLNGQDGRLELVGSFVSEGENAAGYEYEATYAFGAVETPQMSYISPLTDYSKHAYANLAGQWLQTIGPDDESWPHRKIHNGSGTDYQHLYLDPNRPGVILWDVPLLAVDSSGNYVYPYNQTEGYEEKMTTSLLAADLTQSTGRYDRYSKMFTTTGSVMGQAGASITSYQDLYLGGNKAGLTQGDFGFATFYRPWNNNPGINNYGDMFFYDRAALASAQDVARYDTVQFTGHVLMVDEALQQNNRLPVFDGDMGMSLNFANAYLTGYVDMGQNSQYNLGFDGNLHDVNQLSFTGQNLHEASGGVLLKGTDGALESVGGIYYQNEAAEDYRVYTYGAREVLP